MQISLFSFASLLVIGILLVSFSLISVAAADRSERQTVIRAMCANEMFCWKPVFNQAPSSRRAVTVPCPSAFGKTGFDTADGLLHIGDFYFQESTNKYVAYVDAGITATSTPGAPQCVGPHFVESPIKPVGMREVHQTANSYYQSCMLDGKEIAVRISAEEYAALATAHGIPPLKIDPTQQVNCIYTPQVQNPSPRRR